MYYVYLLQSISAGRLYIGSTDDLQKRFLDHNEGRVKSTKGYCPYRLVYYEAYSNKTDARKRELELKKYGQQKEILLRRIENSLDRTSGGRVV